MWEQAQTASSVIWVAYKFWKQVEGSTGFVLSIGRSEIYAFVREVKRGHRTGLTGPRGVRCFINFARRAALSFTRARISLVRMFFA